MMGQGKDEKWIVEQAARTGQSIPARIRDAPELKFGLELYWEAFLELSTCRGVVDGGVLPIPFTAIVEYAKIFDFDEEQTSDLLYLIRIMDGVYLTESERRRKHGG